MRADEFLTCTKYHCQVIVTNVSPRMREFQLLYQVPEGAIPLEKSRQIKCENNKLQPFTTYMCSFTFYFPQEGDYKQRASNVCASNVVIARGGAHSALSAKAHRALTEITSFDDLLDQGDEKAILNYLASKSLYSQNDRFHFTKLGPLLLSDRSFFESATSVLRARCIYEPQVWKFALHHCHSTTLASEALEMDHSNELSHLVGTQFESGLFSVDEHSCS